MDGVSACPFCGGSNQRVKSSGRWGWFVSCSCAAVGPSANSRDEAIEAWNTRNEPVQASLFSDAQFNEDKELHELTLDVADVLGENAKLRELVRDLYEMAYPEYPSAFAAAFADRMHELGVEVDE